MASDTKAVKRYQAGVERALGLFDATNEWADYIAFLGRLLKALQAAPPNADIPLKSLLAQRLAHCLTPALPAGVHQKALEVYDCIFAILAQNGLSTDLSIYLPGISHTLTFASLTTRPWFLALYDDHILKLPGSSLRPALKALILSLLPGIEEENSEDFDKTLGTLNKLRQIFAHGQDEGIFWQSLFLASITSPSRRGGALVYLVRYLPKVSQSTDSEDALASQSATTTIKDIITPEPGLLFRCFATGLQDEQPLVQRGFLDLLVTHLPLNSTTLQKPESKSDLEILLAAAMSIVLRRDMGLNRRLWAWFFGDHEKSDAEVGSVKSTLDASRQAVYATSPYFATFGLQAAISTLDKMLQNPTTKTPGLRARPFRLTVSLMDRAAIGGPVVDALFVRLITNLKLYQTSAPSQDAFDEVFRSANVLFDSIDPRKLTRSLIKLILEQNWELIEFIVLNFNLDEVELGRTHLPGVVACMSSLLTNGALVGKRPMPSGEALPSHEKVGMILDVLVDFVPVQFDSKVRGSPASMSVKELVAATTEYYLNNDQDPYPPNGVTAEALLTVTADNLAQAIAKCLEGPTSDLALDHLTSAFCKVMKALPASSKIDGAKLVRQIVDRFATPLMTDATTFAVCRNIAILLDAFAEEESQAAFFTDIYALQVVPALLRHLWQYLNPSTPQYHVESVDIIWSLRQVYPQLLLVDSTLIDLIVSPSEDDQPHPSVNFAILWTHTKRPVSPNQPAANGPTNLTIELGDFLEQAVVLSVDKSQDDSSWTTWLGTLSSLDFHFQAILRAISNSLSAGEDLMVGLYRMRKLIQIARKSPALWKEMNDDSGPATTISNLALTMVSQHSSSEQSAQVALDILKAIHAESSTAVSSELIDALTAQLPKTRPESSLQSSVLDTLHALMSGKPDGSPPAGLLAILMEGIASPFIESNLDKWITLLCNSIPTYSDATFFANLLKLTACFCKRVQAFFATLKAVYENSDASRGEYPTANWKDPERSITNLLSGLEYILARAHTKVLDIARSGSANQETATSEGVRSRTMENHRLTVVLCMQDAIKVCCQMWFWRTSKTLSAVADTKSFTYMSARLRSKTRRMLEHLLEAEPQECLETVMGIWIESTKASSQPSLVMNLLQTLDGARPKFMLPAIFNALYSRTNPGVLDRAQRSTLSVQASALELVAFLIDYVGKLEDDLLEEIWSDCVSFMKDVLANPMPHRQLLLRLLEFVAALCVKMENTTFGEQSRMRRELADLATRLFTAIFTIKPGGMDLGSRPGSTKELTGSRVRLEAGRGIDILLEVLPVMKPILSEGDRITTVYQGISTNIVGPSLRSRSFPQTLDNNVLGLCQIMAKGSSNSKTWKKDVTDAFNDPRLFTTSVAVAVDGWLPIVRQLSTVDKTLFGELGSRFVAPAAAGIMFGVGASAARTEADKATRANLRRLAVVLLSQEKDFFAGNLGSLLNKIEELLTATPSSSPSSHTRGDIYLLLRAIVLAFAQENLFSVWPVVDSEIRRVFKDLSAGEGPVLTSYSHLQGAKLLDLLLLLNPEEFQLHEWLFITDTIDAIYPPTDSARTASADLIRLEGSQQIDLHSSLPSGLRKPWLATDLSRQPQAASSLLGSFFSQLSIRAFEATYSLEAADLEACRDDLLADLFSDLDSTA